MSKKALDHVTPSGLPFADVAQACAYVLAFTGGGFSRTAMRLAVDTGQIKAFIGPGGRRLIFWASLLEFCVVRKELLAERAAARAARKLAAREAAQAKRAALRTRMGRRRTSQSARA